MAAGPLCAGLPSPCAGGHAAGEAPSLLPRAVAAPAAEATAVAEEGTAPALRKHEIQSGDRHVCKRQPDTAQAVTEQVEELWEQRRESQEGFPEEGAFELGREGKREVRVGHSGHEQDQGYKEQDHWKPVLAPPRNCGPLAMTSSWKHSVKPGKQLVNKKKFFKFQNTVE